MPVYQLPQEPVFPKPSEAEDDGLLAIGGDLSPQRLVNAYKSGIFPWYSEGSPILWWSPNPRLVLFPQKFRPSKSLQRVVKSRKFEATFDNAFEKVIENCARVKRAHEDSTWITDEMISAYTKLHKKGIAHSVEVFYGGELVGGLYGVSLGNAFFGESMFHLMTDASKVAFCYLVERLKNWQFDIIDAQVYTEHLISLGAEEICRNSFLEILDKSLKEKTRIGKW